MNPYDYNILNDVYQNEIFPRKVADVYKILADISQRIWDAYGVLSLRDSYDFHRHANNIDDRIAVLNSQIAANNQKMIECIQRNNRESNAEIYNIQQQNASLFHEVEELQKKSESSRTDASRRDEEKRNAQTQYGKLVNLLKQCLEQIKNLQLPNTNQPRIEGLVVNDKRVRASLLQKGIKEEYINNYIEGLRNKLDVQKYASMYIEQVANQIIEKYEKDHELVPLSTMDMYRYDFALLEIQEPIKQLIVQLPKHNQSYQREQTVLANFYRTGEFDPTYADTIKQDPNYFHMGSIDTTTFGDFINYVESNNNSQKR